MNFLLSFDKHYSILHQQSSPPRPERPHGDCDKLTRGETRGQKRPFQFCSSNKPPCPHSLTHTYTRRADAQGWLAGRGLPWRQDQGEKEGQRRDRWCREGMVNGQELIFFFFFCFLFGRGDGLLLFFFFLCYLLSFEGVNANSRSFLFTPSAEGHKVKILLQLCQYRLLHMLI